MADIRFDWKKFRDDKPEIGSRIVVQYLNWYNGYIVLCSYVGVKDGKHQLINLSKTDLRAIDNHTISTYRTYEIPNIEEYDGYDPHSFEWDYFNIIEK